ncbi:MAG: trigger factor family protein, partial [Bacteroidetes bacterium]|nr:trigger factor family protein [Bacteroidota bacterium]
MNIALEKTDSLNAVVSITVEKSDYEQKVEEALRKQRRNAQIRGFRPGMAPMGMIKKLYGKAILFEELNHIVSHKLMDYIKEEKLDILGDPLPRETGIDDLIGKDTFTFSFDLGLSPEFDPVFTKKHKIPYYVITPDDKMREGFLENHRRRHGEFRVDETVEPESMIRGTVLALGETMEPAENGIHVHDASLLIS